MLNQVAEGVWVRQSAWVWSNAIAVRGEGGLILVDPGIDGSELNQLADDLEGLGLFAVWWETALAQRIPPQLLSRVSAWDWMGSLALLPAGYLLAGPAGQWLGASRVLVGGGLLGLVVFALGLLPTATRNLMRIEEPRSAR